MTPRTYVTSFVIPVLGTTASIPTTSPLLHRRPSPDAGVVKDEAVVGVEKARARGKIEATPLAEERVPQGTPQPTRKPFHADITHQLIVNGVISVSSATSRVLPPLPPMLLTRRVATGSHRVSEPANQRSMTSRRREAVTPPTRKRVVRKIHRVREHHGPRDSGPIVVRSPWAVERLASVLCAHLLLTISKPSCQGVQPTLVCGSVVVM